MKKYRIKASPMCLKSRAGRTCAKMNDLVISTDDKTLLKKVLPPYYEGCTCVAVQEKRKINVPLILGLGYMLTIFIAMCFDIGEVRPRYVLDFWNIFSGMFLASFVPFVFGFLAGNVDN